MNYVNLFTNGQGGKFGDWWSLAFVLLSIPVNQIDDRKRNTFRWLGEAWTFISCAECKVDRLRTKLVHVVVALHVG